MGKAKQPVKMPPTTKWIISFMHGILLLAFTAFWMNTGFTYGDEKLLTKWTSILKRVVLKIDKDPAKQDYIFINLAYEKALIPRGDGIGNEVITDRRKLADFFSVLKKNQRSFEFAVCDVFLQGDSPDDSLLKSSVTGINKIVFPTHFQGNGKVEKLALSVPSAIADYKIISGGFSKFRIVQDDELSTVPVYLYEKISGRKLSNGKWFNFDNGTPIINNLIVDYQIRSHEVFEQSEYPVVSLSELMMLPEEVIINEFLKGRIIVMGDFNSDVHDTVFGSTPGALILLNVFLGLMDGNHLISIWWVIFLLVGYTVFSRQMLFPSNVDSKNIKWVGPLIGSVTFLTILSIFSFMLFDKHIQVLVMTLYISSLRFVIQLRQTKWNWNQTATWLLHLRKTYLSFK